MNVLTVAVDVLGLLSLPIAIVSLLRTLYRDQIVAELRFERDRIGDKIGFIVVENPLNHSIYLDDIVFTKPGGVMITLHGQSLDSTLQEGMDGKPSSRIPPRDSRRFDCIFVGLDDREGVRCTFKWGQMRWWWRLGFLFPSSLSYSADEIELRMRAAKRAEDGNPL